MKKIYAAPEMELIRIKLADVILNSTEILPSEQGEGEFPSDDIEEL